MRTHAIATYDAFVHQRRSRNMIIARRVIHNSKWISILRFASCNLLFVFGGYIKCFPHLYNRYYFLLGRKRKMIFEFIRTQRANYTLTCTVAFTYAQSEQLIFDDNLSNLFGMFVNLFSVVYSACHFSPPSPTSISHKTQSKQYCIQLLLNCLFVWLPRIRHSKSKSICPLHRM